MQPNTTKQTAMIGLAVAAIASIAILLYVSIVRDFLPGVVELSAVLSVAVVFGVVIFVPRESRKAIQRRINNIRVGRLGFVAVGVAILAATAVLALLIESFPWPAPLILVVIMMVFAFSETEGDEPARSERTTQ